MWALLAGAPLAGTPLAAQAQVAPTISIAFAPASIQSGATSQLSIAFTNPNDGAAVLTSTLIDTLPQGLTLVSGAVTGTCPAGAVHAGGGVITYSAGSQIPALGGCSIAVSVKATSAVGVTYYTDSIGAGALQTTNGNNAAGASGTLAVHAVSTVPKLTGLTQTAALTALQAAGLVVGAIQYGGAPAGTPFDTVFSQVPAAGTTVNSGSAVTIHVSTGRATNVNQPLTSTPGLVQPAQQSVAGGFERLCAELQAPTLVLSNEQQNLLANCRAILDTYGGGNNAAGLVSTLNAISGRQASAIAQTGLFFAGTQFTNLATRLAQLRQGVSGFSVSGLDTGSPAQAALAEFWQALRSGTPPASGSSGTTSGSGTVSPSAFDPAGSVGGASGDSNPNDQQSRWGFFINGNLRRGTQDTTTNEQGFNYASTGFTAGVDYRATDHLIFGLALAHFTAVTDFNDGSGRLDSRSNSVSFYGTWFNEAWYLDVIGGYAVIPYDVTRTTTYAINPAVLSPLPTNCSGATCTIDTQGETGARQTTFGSSLGYSWHVSGLELGPDVALDYVHLSVNGFAENDPNETGMGLVFDNQVGESLALKAGGHASYAISTPFAVVLPQVSARYVHEFKNDQRALDVHFENDPSAHLLAGPVSTFQVYSDAPDRSYMDWSAGITAQFPFGIAAFANYNAIGGYSSIQLREYAFGIRFQHLVN